jgi:hypothetical protein
MPVMQQLPDKDEISLVDFLPEFFGAFEAHINQSQDRWGNEWLRRPILESDDWESQNERIYQRYDDYWAYLESGQIDDIPWMKIIGNAFIAWIRLHHPELFPDGQVHPYYEEEDE